jgi:hypothetical protein
MHEILRGDLPATICPERPSLFLSNNVGFVSAQHGIARIQGLNYKALQFILLFCVHLKLYHTVDVHGLCVPERDSEVDIWA